jgi:hypothetical protein
LENLWNDFVAFLKEHDLESIIELARLLDWSQVLTDPVTWLLGIPSILFIIYKKMFRLILLFASIIAFIALTQVTFTPPGQSMPLSNLLIFLGGSTVLLVINFYFLFIRED